MSIIKTYLPSIKGHFGQHILTFQTQLTPSDLNEFLGYDIRDLLKPKKKLEVPTEVSEIHGYVQRKLIAPRLGNIGSYIRERSGSHAKLVGGFPAMSICLSYPGKFKPSEPGSSMGSLEVDLPRSNPRIVIDGFGRGVASVVMALENQIDLGTLPVTIFAPTESKAELTKKDMGQLFYDFNCKQTPIQSAHGLRLDNSDIWLFLANELATLPTISSFGGMELGAKKLGKSSHALVPQQQLKNFVRGVCEGPRFQESARSTKSTYNLTEETYPEVLAKIEDFLALFASKMGSNFGDQSFVHLSYVGFGAIGLIFHDLMYVVKAEERSANHVITKLAEIDWSRFNRDWGGMLGEFDSSGRLAIGNAGRTTRSDLPRYLQKKTGVDLLLVGNTARHPQAAASSSLGLAPQQMA